LPSITGHAASETHVTFAKRDRFAPRDDPVGPRVHHDPVSFEYEKIAETIEFALDVVHGESQRVFVGGIAASLMHQRFLDEPDGAASGSFAGCSTRLRRTPSS